MVTPDDRGYVPQTTFSDAKLQAFYKSAVVAVGEKHKNVQDPKGYRVPGRCWCNDECKWNTISQLVDRFWNHGPDVDDAWKSDAQRSGFDPEELHDTLLGVFVVGTSGPVSKLPRPTAGTPLTR